jgi:hypothetical protein
MFGLLLISTFKFLAQREERTMTQQRRAPRFFGVIQPSGRDWPAAPHDPRERLLVTTISRWQVRVFPEVRARSLLQRGLWHLQLWEPEARLSVLTPSATTASTYEVLSLGDGWKVRVESRSDLVKLLRREHEGAFLSEPGLARLERWLVPGGAPRPEQVRKD